MRFNRPTVAVAIAAGLAVSSTSASAQVINWAMPVDGVWSSTASWTGMMVPGAMNTPRLGLSGTYNAVVDSNRTHAGLSITNPNATATVRSGFTLTLGAGGISNAGTVVINDLISGFGSTVNLADASTLNGTVVLNGPSESLAVLSAPLTLGTSVSFLPGSVVTGQGRINGTLINSQGDIIADGTTLRLQVNDLVQTPTATVSSLNGANLIVEDRITGGSLFVDATSQMSGTAELVDVAVDFELGGLIAENSVTEASDWSGDATLRAGSSLTIKPGSTFAGSLIISDRSNGFGSSLILTDGASVGGTVFLNAQSTESLASLNTPSGVGNSGTLVSSGLVTGLGRIDGARLNSMGSIVADGAFINVLTNFVDQTSGGAMSAINGGRLAVQDSVLGGTLFIDGTSILDDTGAFTGTNITFGSGAFVDDSIVITDGSVSGGFTLRAGVSTTVNGTTDFSATAVISDQSNGFASTFIANDGVVIDGTIVLNSPTAESLAVFQTPAVAETAATLSATGLITGRGRIDGEQLNNAGAILVDGSYINILTNLVDQTGGGSIIAINAATVSIQDTVMGGTLFIDGTSILDDTGAFTNTDITFGAGAFVDDSIVITNGSVSGGFTLRAGVSTTVNGTTDFTATMVVNDQSNGFGAALNVGDGVVIDGAVILNSLSSDSLAVFQTSSVDGTSSTLGATGLITGNGRLDGDRLINQGQILVDGEYLNILIDDIDQSLTGSISTTNGGAVNIADRVTGGVVSIGPGSTLTGTAEFVDVDADFGADSLISDSTVFSGGALTGEATIRAIASVTLRDNADSSADITVSDRSNGFTSTLSLGDGVTLNGTVTLNAAATSLAVLTGPVTAGELASIAPGTPISGNGRLDGRFVSMPAALSPGFVDMGVTTQGVIEMIFDIPTAFTNGTTVGIDLLNPGVSDRLGMNANTTLDGTITVSGANGFNASLNEVYSVGTGGYNGRFDLLTYTGPVPAGQAARLFYEASSIQFAVVCEPDYALPIGTINVFDILSFLEVWNAGTQGADYDNSGAVNIFDILAFLGDWNAGCP